MGSDRKWIVLSYIVATLLCAWVLNEMVALGLSYAHVSNRKQMGVMLTSQLISAVVTGVGAFIYFRQEKVNRFSTEVLAEVKKVAWPVWKNTYLSTAAVIVAVLIASAILWAYDAICTGVIAYVLGLQG